MTSPEITVAVRTHFWDEAIARCSGRLQSSVPAARFVVLADESHGAIYHAGFEKISHDNDFSAYGLPNFPASRVLWYNADYALYALRRALPGMALYALVEYDAVINIDFGSLLEVARERQLDLVTSGIAPATPDWFWTQYVAHFYEKPLGSFLPIIIISARAIDFLLQKRLEMVKPIISDFHDWPFCEAFIPSALRELPDYRFEPLQAHADLRRYGASEPFHFEDSEVYAEGTICHPVLGGRRFIERCIAYGGLESVFDPASMLRRKLRQVPAAAFMPVLLDEMAKHGDAHMPERFEALAAQQGWNKQALLF